MESLYFGYRHGVLHAEALSLPSLAKEFGTPLYVYSLACLENTFKGFKDAFQGQNALIAYSVKANSNQSIIAAFSKLGAGADVVSEGELRRSLCAGIPGERIVFSGVGKTGDELEAGLRAGVHQFNLESESQLRLLSEIAEQVGRVARVAIRVNPDVDAGTHDKIATGRKADKFGVPIQEASALYELAGRLPGVDTVGVDLHIGSQLTDLGPFRVAFLKLAELIRQIGAQGHHVKQIDLGGGLGVCYEDEKPPSVGSYAELVKETLGEFGCQIILEPGRALVAGAGILLCKVVEVKGRPEQRFVIVDAAMNDLLRPALYDAWHLIKPVVQPKNGCSLEVVDVVGPVCESGDILGRSRKLPKQTSGDLLAICSVGAYGSVMSSSYNSRPPAAEILVSEAKSFAIRPRQTLDKLIDQDRLPDWLFYNRDDLLKESR